MTDARKYAEKYDSVEDLEKGYKELSSLHGTTASRIKELEAHTKVPDAYVLPEGMKIDDADDIKDIAKDASMTQAQFEKYLKRIDNDRKSYYEALETEKKTIGESDLNVLNDHIKRHYPEDVQNDILEKALFDKSFRDAELKRRDAVLNSTVPGINAMPGEKQLSQKEFRAICDEHFKDPNDPEKLAEYIEANQKMAAQKELAKKMNSR